MALQTKPVRWIGSSREDLQNFPQSVRRVCGYALWRAQLGERHQSVKILKGYKGGGILEIIANWDGSTYRLVYAVRFAKAV